MSHEDIRIRVIDGKFYLFCDRMRLIAVDTHLEKAYQNMVEQQKAQRLNAKEADLLSEWGLVPSTLSFSLIRKELTPFALKLMTLIAVLGPITLFGGLYLKRSIMASVSVSAADYVSEILPSMEKLVNDPSPVNREKRVMRFRKIAEGIRPYLVEGQDIFDLSKKENKTHQHK